VVLDVAREERTVHRDEEGLEPGGGAGEVAWPSHGSGGVVINAHLEPDEQQALEEACAARTAIRRCGRDPA
jgi:hypothetical protein